MHTNPEVLALLALGEDTGTAGEREHVETCEICAREVAELAHLTGVGRAVEDATPLESPSPEVWRRIQAELGFRVTATEVVTVPVSSPTTPLEPVAPAAHQLTAAEVPPAEPGSVPPPGEAPELSEVTETGRALIRPSTDSDADLITPAGSDTTAPSSRNRRVLALVLAAAIALIAGVGIGLGWNSLAEPSPTVIGEAQLEPGAADWTGASGEATLERTADGQRILVVRVSTPRQVPGIRTVWIMDSTNKKMQTVGQLTGDVGRFAIDPETNLADFPVVDVSQEPKNDVNPVHSGVTILRGTLNI